MTETRTTKQIAADKLDELIERLEKAEGPDRELDFWLTVRVFDPSNHSDEELQADIDLVGIDGMHVDAPFTASLDAAVDLAEHVLKVYRLEIFMDPSGVSAKVTWWPCGLHETDAIIKSEGMGWTPAVSICLATLKAVRAHMHPRDREGAAE